MIGRDNTAPREEGYSLSVRALHTLRIGGDTAHEAFWVLPSALEGTTPPWIDPGDVMSTQERPAPAPTEGRPPLLVWDEAVSRLGDVEDPVRWYFSGNRAAEELPTPDPDELDARGVHSLVEEDFWSVIDLLGDKVTARSLNAAARSMVSRDDEWLLAWAETAGRKALALHNVFTSSGAAADEPNLIFPIGAVIAQGAETYDKILDEPSGWKTEWVSDYSPQVLWLASRALKKRRRGLLTVRTSFTSTQLREVEMYGQMGRESASAGEDGQVGYNFRAARALIEHRGEVRTRIILADAPNDGTDPRALLGRAAESFGGRLMCPVEVEPTAYAQEIPWNSDVFRIVRKFDGSRDDYLGRFWPGRLDSARGPDQV